MAWDNIKGLSKDLVDGLLSKAGQQKDVLVQAVAGEVSKFLQRLNVSEELKKLLDDMTIDLHAKVDLKRRSSGKNLSTLSHHVKLSGGSEKSSSGKPKKRVKSKTSKSKSV